MNTHELISKCIKSNELLYHFSNNFEWNDKCIEQKVYIYPDQTLETKNFGTDTVLVKELIDGKLYDMYVFSMGKKYVKYDVVWTHKYFNIKYNTLSSEFKINGGIDYQIDFTFN